MSDGLTVFQYDLLAALHDGGPQKGTAIKSRLERERERYDGVVQHGRMYPNLNELVSAGLVDKGSRDERTNEYALTRAGAEALGARVCELGGEWTNE
jgi:PadR family transcriptional regulator PadR